ncbi:LuxR C-terminal-related transcriptional regulator [Vibrio sp. ZSDZ65]|uniref:LuxR C-terminal-related transcriptional regulator n=1 Tax=Vibrio qingdaonensis TaxID=2829491 RepID=A0A9X3CNF1_9VIBR|nr:LuxR C-terminal-related transcriptional regulator [Vibrio qingdaonensis]MCW8346441.1 LuxR C-terminal-related transcriptional regulator [Vibrio qingdaonensis]
MLRENSINFIVVESQPLLLHSLTKVIEELHFTANVYSLKSLDEIEDYVQSKSIHCIIFDPLSDVASATSVMLSLTESRPHIYNIAYSMNISSSFMRLFETMNIKGVVSRLDSIDTLEAALTAAANGYVFKKCRVEDEGNEVHLSKRELSVLQLLTDGHRNKEIARRLNISDKTVSTYKKRVLEKFNVDNIMGLISEVSVRGGFLTNR